MPDQQLYDVWWHDDAAGEQSMEENHAPHWRKLLAMVEEQDLSAYNILDFGCNQGGFLRFLYGRRPFASGTGIDLARDSITVANQRKRDLPLTYEATADIEKFGRVFDLIFSSAVIYLVQDLAEHARKIKAVLKPGGVYYCTYTDYSKNPSLLRVKKTIDRNGALPMQLHALDDIADAFFAQGFSVAIRRMPPQGYISLEPQDPWFNSIADRMQYEYEEAFIFRFTAPES